MLFQPLKLQNYLKLAIPRPQKYTRIWLLEAARRKYVFARLHESASAKDKHANWRLICEMKMKTPWDGGGMKVQEGGGDDRNGYYTFFISFPGTKAHQSLAEMERRGRGSKTGWSICRMFSLTSWSLPRLLFLSPPHCIWARLPTFPIPLCKFSTTPPLLWRKKRWKPATGLCDLWRAKKK